MVLKHNFGASKLLRVFRDILSPAGIDLCCDEQVTRSSLIETLGSVSISQNFESSGETNFKLENLFKISFILECNSEENNPIHTWKDFRGCRMNEWKKILLFLGFSLEFDEIRFFDNS